jgi:hypothetical protein
VLPLWEIAPRPGPQSDLYSYSPELIKAMIEVTLQSKPIGMIHWSCRLMAANLGISKSTVSILVLKSQRQAVPHENVRAVAGPEVPAETTAA